MNGVYPLKTPVLAVFDKNTIGAGAFGELYEVNVMHGLRVR